MLGTLAVGLRLYPAVEALMTLRGFQLVAATVLVAELGDIRRFEPPRDLMGYLGLNGLLRKYLPQGTSLHCLRKSQSVKIAEKLTTRPRLRLGFYTPNEVYYGINELARDWAASCVKLFATVLRSGPIGELTPGIIGVALQI